MDQVIIYDIGANVGKNLYYYLLKADLVVAVEPNPTLAAHIRTEHAMDIAQGRLAVVESAVTAAEHSSERVTLHVSPGADSRGSTLEGGPRDGWTECEVDTVSVSELFSTFGDPYFVKIDIEGHDATVLRDVLTWPRLPEFVSVEAHDPAVAALLTLATPYQGFQVIVGKRVSSDFFNHPIMTRTGPRRWDFPWHSAGPFGDDLPRRWLDRSGLVGAFGRVGPGWVDIHAALSPEGATAAAMPTTEDEEPEPRPNELLRHAAECLATGLSRVTQAITRRLITPTTLPIPDGVFEPLREAGRATCAAANAFRRRRGSHADGLVSADA